jgi:hypothetical protein
MGSQLSVLQSVEQGQPHTLTDPRLVMWMRQFNSTSWDSTPWVNDFGAFLGDIVYSDSVYFDDASTVMHDCIGLKSKDQVIPVSANGIVAHIYHARQALMAHRLNMRKASSSNGVYGLPAYTIGDLLIQIAASAIGRVAMAKGYPAAKVHRAVVLLEDRFTHAPCMHAMEFPSRWAVCRGFASSSWADHTLSDHLETLIYVLAIRGETDRLYCVVCFLFMIAYARALI